MLRNWTHADNIRLLLISLLTLAGIQSQSTQVISFVLQGDIDRSCTAKYSEIKHQTSRQHDRPSPLLPRRSESPLSYVPYPPSQLRYTAYGSGEGDIGQTMPGHHALPLLSSSCFPLRSSTLRIRAPRTLWLPPITSWLQVSKVRSTLYDILDNSNRPERKAAATASDRRYFLRSYRRHSRNPALLGVVVLQLVTDIVSDSILIIAPLRLLRNLSDRKLRRRLTVIFSTCLITTAVSLVHAAFLFIHAAIKVLIAAIVECSVSLIVCNVPVVATSLLRVLRGQRASDTRTGYGTSGIRFATSRTRTTASAGEAATMTIGALGWTSNFRWERELPESESELEPSVATTVLSNVDLKSRPAVEVQLSDVSAKAPSIKESRESDRDSAESQKRMSL
ncbi:putative expressed protein [Lyophyllum shimeji]|uniref:Expressed protein n=1 Tax=Lyophyllum shimeji TaxID=47721 RepID=A0A9P3UNW0_LYOSH|nr:putative expressed protein [Lyophyllum shimeji]